MKVRVKLEFVIEDKNWKHLPSELNGIYPLIEGALDNIGLIGNGKAVDVLPGSKLSVSVVREKKVI